MHILHECRRFQIYGMQCPQGHPFDEEADKDSEKQVNRRSMADEGADFDQIFWFLHRQKSFRDRVRQMEGQPKWEPFAQEFPEPIPFPREQPIHFPRKETLRPAASVSTGQSIGGAAQLNRLYSLRGMELLRQKQPSLQPSQVRTIERLSARGLNNLRQIGGGRTITAKTSMRGSGRGFITNAASQLKRDIGIAASFRKERPRKKERKLLSNSGAWTSSFPGGYFG